MTYNYEETLITDFKTDERGRTSYTMQGVVYCIAVFIVISVVVVDVFFPSRNVENLTGEFSKKRNQDKTYHSTHGYLPCLFVLPDNYCLLMFRGGKKIHSLPFFYFC